MVLTDSLGRWLLVETFLQSLITITFLGSQKLVNKNSQVCHLTGMSNRSFIELVNGICHIYDLILDETSRVDHFNFITLVISPIFVDSFSQVIKRILQLMITLIYSFSH